MPPSEDRAGGLDLTAISAFLFHEAELLDQRRFEEWEELFTADAYYWVPARAGQTDPAREVSIFYDDRALMRTRIQRLRHPRIHIQTPPSVTCRFISNIRLDADNPPGSDALVRSSLMVGEHRLTQQRTFMGHCQHGLRLVDGTMRIAWKRIDLINAEDVFDPIAILL